MLQTIFYLYKTMMRNYKNYGIAISNNARKIMLSLYFLLLYKETIKVFINFAGNFKHILSACIINDAMSERIKRQKIIYILIYSVNCFLFLKLNL